MGHIFPLEDWGSSTITKWGKLWKSYNSNLSISQLAKKLSPSGWMGVYSITNKQNRKRYIGSSANIQKRVTHHLTALRAGRHSNRYLQKEWEEYGAANFELEVLSFVKIPDGSSTNIHMKYYNGSDPHCCRQHEFSWMEHFVSYDPTQGYNSRRRRAISDEKNR